MELKIRIKEVKEEMRELTIEERCLMTVAWGPCCSKEYRAEASAKLDLIGVVSYQGTLGKFRTVTIRDATEIETIAWHCTQIRKSCDMNGVDCYANCPKRLGCEVVLDYKKSMAILEGKDVILEVI